MKGLLLKDFYTIIKQLKVFVLMIVIFALIPNFSVSVFAVVYAAMLPITTLAYDERCKWDTLAAMMPYSPAALVLSKYLLGLLGVLCAGLLSAFGYGIQLFLLHAADDGSFWFSLLAGICTALLLLAINLPLMYRFGVEKGRLFFFALIALLALLLSLCGDAVTALLQNADQIMLAAALLPVLAFALFAFSGLVSIYIYEHKKEISR
ncbi:MAG: ABC-2 transporter permease [Acutalibacteraceae bacterium]|jgi:ABC-2 type transport system permease protein